MLVKLVLVVVRIGGCSGRRGAELVVMVVIHDLPMISCRAHSLLEFARACVSLAQPASGEQELSRSRSAGPVECPSEPCKTLLVPIGWLGARLEVRAHAGRGAVGRRLRPARALCADLRARGPAFSGARLAAAG